MTEHTLSYLGETQKSWFLTQWQDFGVFRIKKKVIVLDAIATHLLINKAAASLAASLSGIRACKYYWHADSLPPCRDV